MASFGVQVRGTPELRRALARVSDARPIFEKALRRIGLEIQRIAVREEIIKGGQQPPHPSRLTSRTGTGRRSITVDLAQLPRQVSVGTPLRYMAVHETGGTVSRGPATVRQHTRNVAFGRRVQPFQVGPYTRGAHTARYPARPFLRPAARKVEPRMADIVVDIIRREAS